MCEQIIKAYSGISIIHVKMNSLTTTSELKMLCFLLHKEKAMWILTYPRKILVLFFQVDDSYFGLRVNYFQQWEINIDLKASLF